MSKRIVECPGCGSQDLSVTVKMEYDQYYSIHDNSLYRNDKSPAMLQGDIWLWCRSCAQEEEISGESEWKATPEQHRLVWDMILESRSADVTKQMEKEHDGE